MYVLRNEPSNLFYTFTGSSPHVERSQAHLFESEQAARNCAAILNDAGRGRYIPELVLSPTFIAEAAIGEQMMSDALDSVMRRLGAQS